MENLKAGGSYVIRKGIYGEELSGINSGLEGLRSTIRSYAGEKVITSGASRVNSLGSPGGRHTNGELLYGPGFHTALPGKRRRVAGALAQYGIP